MFVLAGGSVGAPAGPEFHLAAVEVLLELAPLLRGRVAVLAGWSDLAAVVQVGLVVADDVFVEAGDVAARGLDIQVAE
ncbi:hypothetical protein [Streptomyces drozdowiczii]|uniref:hypothetical protein n=1 Tax=Streptomyces drozdowiczii TaxID=202862 RepID=UPI00403CF155